MSSPAKCPAPGPPGGGEAAVGKLVNARAPGGDEPPPVTTLESLERDPGLAESCKVVLISLSVAGLTPDRIESVLAKCENLNTVYMGPSGAWDTRLESSFGSCPALLVDTRCSKASISLADVIAALPAQVRRLCMWGDVPDLETAGLQRFSELEVLCAHQLEQGMLRGKMPYYSLQKASTFSSMQRLGHLCAPFLEGPFDGFGSLTTLELQTADQKTLDGLRGLPLLTELTVCHLEETCPKRCREVEKVMVSRKRPAASL